MKSQRRHELQQNALKTELTNIGSFIRARSNLLAWLLLGVAVVVLGVVLWHRNSAQKEAQHAVDFNRLVVQGATDLKPDERVAQMKDLANSDSNKLRAATIWVELGNEFAGRMITAPTEAQRQAMAQEAAGYFQTVLDRYGDQPIPVAKAHLGLAKLAVNMGDLDKAKAQFQIVIAMPELTNYPIVKLAAQELDGLSVVTQPVRMATTTSAPTSQSTTATAASTSAPAEPAGATMPTATQP